MAVAFRTGNDTTRQARHRRIAVLFVEFNSRLREKRYVRTTPSLKVLLYLAGIATAGFVIGIWSFLAVEDRLKPEIVMLESSADELISVAITGAVETEGVFDLPVGARLADLLDAAGGPAANADLTSLNLARRLDNLEMIHVPLAVALATPSSPSVAPQMGFAANDPRLDLNTATLEQLDGLPGIGPVLAQAIIDERTRLGGFTSIEQMERISGISARMVEALQQLVRVD